MISPSDVDYQETKLIKLGQKNLETPIKEIVEWASSAFDVNVLNAHYDLVPPKNRPRLNIIVERTSDLHKFRDTSTLIFNRDAQRQVAEAYQTILNAHKLRQNDLLRKMRSWFDSQETITENLFVIFTAFEPVAKCEANESIPNSEIEKLQIALQCKNLWTISRCFASATFFFHTDEQVSGSKTDGSRERMRDAYFELLIRYDEFNYFDKTTYAVAFDSKENFDKNYQSNWYYYYK